MGLFRRGRRDDVYNSDWTVSAVNRRSSAPDTFERQTSSSSDGSPCSTTEPTDAALDKPLSASASDINTPATNADVLAMKVKLMERTLKQKDETISHLRSAMELEDERVTRLELQIGRLVELSSQDRVREQRTQARIPEPQVAARRRSSYDMGLEEEHHVAKLEITALNELLARVIAEKDRLGYENNNLKSLVRERSSACSNTFTHGASSSGRGNAMPSSIDALDKSLKEHQEMQSMDRENKKLASKEKGSKKSYKPTSTLKVSKKTAGDCDQLSSSSQESAEKQAKVQQREVSPQPKKSISFHVAPSRPAVAREASPPSKQPVKSTSFHVAPSPPAVPQAPAKSTSFHMTAEAANASSFHHSGGSTDKQSSILYQMSCKNCHSGCQHLKFMSSFTATDAKKELTKVLKTHYRLIWSIIQHHEACDDASISSSVHEDELLNQHSNMTSNEWLSSSLARHIAKHCQGLENEVAVMKWCMKNVRVEIQKNMVETSADDFIANATASPAAADPSRRSRSKGMSKSRGVLPINMKKHTSFHL